MGKVRTMKKTKSSNKVSKKHNKRGVKHIKRKMKKSVIKRKSKSKTKSKTKPKKKSKSKSKTKTKTMKGGSFMEMIGLSKPSLENLKSDLQGELTGLRTINTYSDQDKKDSEKTDAYYKISKVLGKLDKHYSDEAAGEKLKVNTHFSGTGAQDKQHYNNQTQQISSKTIDSYDGLGSALKSVFDVPGIV